MKFFKYFLISFFILLAVFVGYVVYDYKQGEYWNRHADGISMEPTIKDGQYYHVEMREPKVGDIISFGTRNVEPSEPRIAKRLIKIDDRNCWWVEGDNKDHSSDSRQLGWLCPNYRIFQGVVTDIKPMK